MAAVTRVPSASVPAHSYRAVFERAGTQYRAQVVDETAHRSRQLGDIGPGCAPIAQAVAVVLATMWGSEGDEPEAPRAPEPPRERMADRAPAPSIPRPVVGPRWDLELGPALVAGIVRPAAPALLGEIAFGRAPWSVALSALWVPDQGLDVSPGTVHVQLVSGGARVCGFVGHAASFGICGRLIGGMLLASASGFDVDSQRTRPWFAAGLEAFVDGPLGTPWLRYRGAAGALAPLHAETFSVAGAGPAYDTPALGGLFTLGLLLVVR
jgi:hypothetical protein